MAGKNNVGRWAFEQYAGPDGSVGTWKVLFSAARGDGDPVARESHLPRAGATKNGVATKCNFCASRIDAGLANGLKPGVDPAATPACVNSCIANALHFGVVEDPASNISELLAEHQHFRLNEELGTGPRMYYLWDRRS